MYVYRHCYLLTNLIDLLLLNTLEVNFRENLFITRLQKHMIFASVIFHSSSIMVSISVEFDVL